MVEFISIMITVLGESMSGKNFSKKRQLILDTIKSTNTHPSAKWVYESLKEDIPDLSLGTVYRNIALFKEEGLVVTVANLDGEERIDGDTSEHAHFVCRECKRVFDIFGSIGAPAKCPLEGFETEHQVLTYFGKCSTCINKTN